jgi:hypothetical protein
MGEYSKPYGEESDSSEDIPVPRFRDLGEMRHRVKRTYELRPKKAVSYAETDDMDAELE